MQLFPEHILHIFLTPDSKKNVNRAAAISRNDRHKRIACLGGGDNRGLLSFVDQIRHILGIGGNRNLPNPKQIERIEKSLNVAATSHDVFAQGIGVR